MRRGKFATEARGLWRDLCRLIQLWYRDLVVLQSGGGEHLLHFRDDVETLRAQLAAAGLAVRAFDFRDIGGETFLWITAARP